MSFVLQIKTEPYKSSSPVQCYSCQHFGYASLYCGQFPRRVKCGNDHLTRECLKPKSEKATCCNCGGDYIANYRGCPYYTQIVKEKRKVAIFRNHETNLQTQKYPQLIKTSSKTLKPQKKTLAKPFQTQTPQKTPIHK